ncbi:hypothetical protein Tco_0929706 [Tanacetum coccineum]
MPATTNISNLEDTDSTYLPKIKSRLEWLNPIPEEDRPETPEPDWSQHNGWPNPFMRTASLANSDGKDVIDMLTADSKEIHDLEAGLQKSASE